jgi:hypothetical protein
MEINSAPGSNHNDEKVEKVRFFWKIGVAIYVLAALGLTFYWEFTGSGLPNLVCEWQGQLLDNKCYIALNILIPLLLFLAPVIILKFILEKSMGFSLNSSGNKKALF